MSEPKDGKVIGLEGLYALFATRGWSKTANFDAYVRSCVDDLMETGGIPDRYEARIYERFPSGALSETNAWVVRELIRYRYKEHARVWFRASKDAERSLLKYLNEHVDHFVHLSKDTPLYIAYTPSHEYGQQDRRVKTTVGRYLKKYWPDMPDADVRAMSDAFRNKYGTEDVKFATTPEEIERVYTQGPNSCMSHPISEKNRWGSHVHPSAVYEYPGVRVAYLERNKRINARSVVYDNPEDPNDKRYIRIYGDDVLRMKLEMMGYEHKAPTGMKLKKIQVVTRDNIPLPGTYVCPYIDDQIGGSGQRVTVKGDHLYVGRSSGGSEHSATSTSGLIGTYSNYRQSQATPQDVILKHKDFECHSCGKTLKGTDGAYSEYYNTVICPNCAEHYTEAFHVSAAGRTVTSLVRKADVIVIEETEDTVVNDEAMILKMGFAKLTHPAYAGFPLGKIFRVRSQCVIDAANHLVSRNDAVRLGKCYYHKNDLVEHAGVYMTTTEDLMARKDLFVDGKFVFFDHEDEDESGAPFNVWMEDLICKTQPHARAQYIERLTVDAPLKNLIFSTLERLLTSDYAKYKDSIPQQELELAA